MSDIVYLDLHLVALFGYEDPQIREIVESMVLGILEGDDFPPVPVVRINQNLYSLSDIVDKPGNPKVSDGGHHRAKAHYLAKVPLKCKVVCDPVPLSSDERIPISDSRMVSDRRRYHIRRTFDQNYRIVPKTNSLELTLSN